MSFQSSDVSIKYRLIKCRSINCQVMRKYAYRNENNSKTLQFTNCCTNITVYKQNSVRSIICQAMKKYTYRNENNSKTLQFTNCCTLQHTDTIENNSNTLHITVYKKNSVNC